MLLDGSIHDTDGLPWLDVLRVIEQDWDFMAGDDCIPVQVSLQLMDSSTLGKADREPDFLRVQRDIQRALRSVVNGSFVA